MKPIACHDFSPEKYPITIRIRSGKTGKELWWRTITLDEARTRPRIEIPSYAGSEHWPVHVDVAYADETIDIGRR